MRTKYFKLKTISTLMFLLGGLLFLQAQSTQVSGKVLGDDGVPLPGANVRLSNSTSGTQTDFDGNFSLNVPDLNATLEVSFIGYMTQNVALNGRSFIEVILQTDVAALSEVVVIGYGTQDKENISGAITAISADAIEGRPVADFQSALQGQVAGLNITNSSGAPGSRANVVIRGVGSITGGSNPLYVVDGNIINNFVGNQGQSFTQPDPLATINPADIESVTVLKDASAAAIYGARAANGVILITTKRGSSGKAKLEFNTFAGFQKATNTLDLLNSNQYQQVMNAARDNAGEQRIPSLDGTTLTVDTDWQDEVLRTAPIQSYQFSATGGGENTRYYTSLNYFDQEGIVIGTGLERFSLQFNSDTRLGAFKFGNSLTISRSLFDKESTNNSRTILTWAIASAPNIPVRDPNSLGGFAGPTTEDGEPTLNPVAAQELVTSENTVTRILGNVYGEFDIFKGLNFRTSLGFDYLTFHDRFTAPEFELGGLQIPGFEQGAEVSELRGENNSVLFENTLNYKNNFGNHNVDLLAGYTVQEQEFENLRARVLGQFTGSGLPVISGSGDVNLARGTRSETRTTSIIARAIYDYDSRYLATFNFRRDGSSKFDPSKFYDNFWSGSIGWVISNEAFLRDSQLISNLKLRASYGALGNDAGGASRFTLNQNASYVFGTGQSITPGVAPAGAIFNPELGWEKQVQTDIGLDVGLFQNKLTFTVDYFDKVSKDLILTVPTPATTGFQNITLNAGEISNKGFEFTGNYSTTFGDDFRFNVGANFTTLDNTVNKLIEDLDAIERSPFAQLSNVTRVRIEPGYSVQSFYGYKVVGIFQNQQEIDNAPTQGGDATAPGDFQYADINDDGVVDENDRTFIGDAVPDFTYGFNFSLGWKGFDLSAQFQGVEGVDIFSETKFFTQAYPRTNNQSVAVLDAWTPSNPSTTTPRAIPQPLSNNDRISDFFIEDGSYLRLKNFQVGYSFSNTTLDRLGALSKARIYMAAQNLLTFSKYTDVGYDPEIGSDGIDNVVYPQARTITFGVQLGF